MIELKEIIRLISRHKVKQIEVIGNESSSAQSTEETLYYKLYNAVSDNLVNSDEEAITYLYGHASNPSQSYNRLKNRLKDRLLNTLFFIDINQPKFSDIEAALISCNRNWMAVRILLLRDARIPAVRLAERTLRVATKYEFTELILFLAKELRLHYSLVHPNTRKYAALNKTIEDNNEILQAELLADRYYSEVMIIFGESQQSLSQNSIDRIQKYSDHLISSFRSINSYRFIRISHLLHIIRYQITLQYDKAISVCNSAIHLIESKPYESGGAIFSFNLRLLSCYVQLQRFHDGETVAQKYSKKLPQGSHQWFLIMFYYFLLSTHSKQYTKSYNILRKVLNEEKFDLLYENLKQLWLIIEAYVHLLISINLIHESDIDETYNKRFRLYRFLNDIPIYSKDKRGINISILVIHTLFLLQQRKFSAIIDRVDALKQYSHRYLRRDDTFRANCFIKMLLQAPKAEFNRIRTERYAEKFLDKLTSMPLNIASQGIEVEIIPYEHLWEITLDLLD